MELSTNAYIGHAEAQHLTAVVDGHLLTFIPKNIQTVMGPLLQSRIQSVLKPQTRDISVSSVTSRTFEERYSPPNVGSLGDIWVDVASMVIYTYDNGWLKWPGNETSTTHPMIRNSRLIHTGDKTFVKWVSASNKTKIMKKHSYLKNLTSRKVFDLVTSLRQEGTQLPIPNKRKAENELNDGVQHDSHSPFVLQKCIPQTLTRPVCIGVWMMIY